MTRRQSRRTQLALERALFGPGPKPERQRSIRPVATATPADEPYVRTCGCPINAPEADPALWPCPCGDHCQLCPTA